MKSLLLKLMLSLSMLILMIGCSFAEGTGTLSHFGVSVMRDSNTDITRLIQVAGSLQPSVERTMIPYSAWQQRLYGFIGIEPTGGGDYCYGVGYYVGKIGMVGIQAGMLNNKELKEDNFIFGLYADGNVFKAIVNNLIGAVKQF